MPPFFLHIMGWFWEHWSQMSSIVITVIAIYLALAPKTIADREKKWAWKIGVIAVVLLFSITGSFEDKMSLDQLKSQISTLFGQLAVAATKNDIGTLTAHIDAGFNDIVSAIKDLNQSTKPTKPTVAIAPVKPSNELSTHIEPPSLPAPPHISFTQARGVSTDPAFTYALQVTIQSDQQVPVAFAVDCTGAVGDVKAFLIGQGVYMSVKLGRNGNAAFVRFGYPPLTPQTPLVITIFSKGDIRAIAVRAL
jgi:hypothetical protein